MSLRKVHRAFVEEINDNIGTRAFVASCHVTGIRCDWLGWPGLSDGGEAGAIAYSIEALNGERGADVFCDAEHVL